MRLNIDHDKCVGCGVCAEACSRGLLALKNRKTYVKEGCDACGECVNMCICSAISIVGRPDSKVRKGLKGGKSV